MGISYTDQQSHKKKQKEVCQMNWFKMCNINVYMYQTPGRAKNWVVAFRSPLGLSDNYYNVIEAFRIATSIYPKFIS